VTITMNLGSGSFTDTSGAPHAGITLVISGSGGTTTIVGHSPALQVSGGNVIVTDLTLVTDTNSPTLVVSGGNLTLRNVDIEESSTSSQAAVQINGGTVDLGTAANPGGNVFNTHGQGQLIHNTGGNGVSAVGNTFEVDDDPLSSPYHIKDKIFDALNAGGGGLVTYVPGQAASGDDLLIAGRTVFDGDLAALAAIMAEWTSARSYADRVANLSGTGSGPRANGNSFLLASGPNKTVFHGGASDVLHGGSGMDWFFANLVTDLVTGLHDAEIVTNLP
jgi:hypothetical protein